MIVAAIPAIDPITIPENSFANYFMSLGSFFWFFQSELIFDLFITLFVEN